MPRAGRVRGIAVLGLTRASAHSGRATAPMQPAVPILMYHDVSSDTPAAFRKYIVTPKAFARQMRWLADGHYTPIDLSTLIAHRTAGNALPSRPVVITFDDGFRDAVRCAGAIVRDHGFRAVLFAVAGLVGRPSEWLLRERGLQRPLADWAELRTLAAEGFEIGAHSLTHPHLPAIDPDEARRQIENSRRVIEDALGREVVHFAYPFGAVDAAVRATVAAAGYRTACTTRIGLSAAGEDPLMLRRVPVTGFDSVIDFACRLRTATSVAQTARAAVRRHWTRLRHQVT
jgi:peptidoglycan/xylan/chitin deacetylase (PgdA/CDA1 family)